MSAATRATNSAAGLRPSASPPMLLYGVTVFVSASLVFWVQPLAVRGLLPAVGGAPLVWNTAMLFFQSMLLAGYLLAHLMVRRLAVLQQMTGLAALWVVALARFLGGVAAPFGETPPQTGTVLPALWLLGTLAFNYGPACLAVSMLTPLVSAWFAQAKDDGADPYVLYAVSNAGSIGILLVYPFVLEPLFGVALQIRLWTAVFAFLWLLLMALGLRSRREAEPGTLVLSRNRSGLLITPHGPADTASCAAAECPPLRRDTPAFHGRGRGAAPVGAAACPVPGNVRPGLRQAPGVCALATHPVLRAGAGGARPVRGLSRLRVRRSLVVRLSPGGLCHRGLLLPRPPLGTAAGRRGPDPFLRSLCRQAAFWAACCRSWSGRCCFPTCGSTRCSSRSRLCSFRQGRVRVARGTRSRLPGTGRGVS